MSVGKKLEKVPPVQEQNLSAKEIKLDVFPDPWENENAEIQTIVRAEKGLPDFDTNTLPLNSNSVIYISSTFIKDVIDKHGNELPYCARKNRALYITKEVESMPTESMTKGIFMETLFIGSGAKGKKVLDLPRKLLSAIRKAELKTKGLPLLGDKTVDQIRIEKQVERGQFKAQELMMQIIPGVNTQTEILHRINDRFYLRGTLDIFPTPIFYEDKIRLAIVDLKLTADIHSTFGDFCWGSPEYMDHLQADLYLELAKNIDLGLNSHLNHIVNEDTLNLLKNEQCIFLYWVFGYKKDNLESQDKFVQRLYRDPNGTDLRQRDLWERIRKTMSCIERDEELGWPVKPSQVNCKNCPLCVKNGGTCIDCTTVTAI